MVDAIKIKIARDARYTTGTQPLFQNFVWTTTGSSRALSAPVGTRFFAHGDSIIRGPTVVTGDIANNTYANTITSDISEMKDSFANKNKSI